MPDIIKRKYLVDFSYDREANQMGEWDYDASFTELEAMAAFRKFAEGIPSVKNIQIKSFKPVPAAVVSAVVENSAAGSPDVAPTEEKPTLQ